MINKVFYEAFLWNSRLSGNIFSGKRTIGLLFINLALDHDHGSEILVVKNCST